MIVTFRPHLEKTKNYIKFEVIGDNKDSRRKSKIQTPWIQEVYKNLG